VGNVTSQSGKVFVLLGSSRVVEVAEQETALSRIRIYFLSKRTKGRNEKEVEEEEKEEERRRRNETKEKKKKKKKKKEKKRKKETDHHTGKN
jgi:predicted ribosome quality control (RQC) complex YloA/Tae2 family protein